MHSAQAGQRMLTFFFDDLNHVADRIHHATHGRCVFQFTGFVHFVQAQTDQRCTLFGGRRIGEPTCFTTIVLAIVGLLTLLRLQGGVWGVFLAEDVSYFLATTLSDVTWGCFLWTDR